MKRRLSRSVALVSVASAAVVGGCNKTRFASAAQGGAGALAVSNAGVSKSRQTAITAAVERVSPSVVTVQTVSVHEIPPNFFWGGGGTQVTPGLGSGFVVRSDGVIVTNAHVVEGADSLSVMLRDGTVYPAKVLGEDPTNDVAVVKIDAKGLQVVTLGNSSSLLVGEWAVAIGNPYGFLLGNSEPSVTAGVISGVGRNLVGGGEGSAVYLDMIQTDASINPGNSGGPLINADGEVVGVNSSIYSPSGGSIGLGFAIPINRVERIVEDLINNKRIRHPWIGLAMQSVSANPRDIIAKGAVVQSVVGGSPAASAGIKTGDIIVGVGTRPVHNPYDWAASLLDLRVGDVAQLTVRRGRDSVKISVTVGDLPEEAAAKVEAIKELQVVTLTPQIRSERNVQSASGAYVYSVSDHLTSETGLKQGDVIVRLNNVSIASADDFKKYLDQAASHGYAVRLYIERGGQSGYLAPFQIGR